MTNDKSHPRRIPNHTLLNLGREILHEHGPLIPFRKFCRLADIAPSTIANHFGGWLPFKKRLGYTPVRARPPRDPRYSRESLLKVFRRLTRQHGPGISRSTFQRRTGISPTVVYSHFDTWADFRKAAGLTPHNRGTKKFSRHALLADLWRVCLLTGQTPSSAQYRLHGHANVETVARHFGSWQAALDACFDFTTRLVEKFPAFKDRTTKLQTLADTITPTPRPEETL
jgi:hypothetical protein